MDLVFLDFHIHTSQNPENLRDNYDIDTLKSRIEEIADGSDYLISLTDHNTINKPAYLEAVKKISHLLLGVELHVRNFDEAKPYHCHILFNVNPIDSQTIDEINSRLDTLYPRKIVSSTDKTIPRLENITNAFDEYDFILLPHGGQNHSTFDMSIPEGVQFDRTLERSIYYNLFEGFTARSNTSLERTHRYFERLGIRGFINLVTATDNYVPKDYPDCRAGRDASEFTPTWMLASPTFDGLRLSLSESSRLAYGEKPDSWAECIERVKLKNDYIDIDIALTPGLNVVIGGSSSGKSLLVDSIVKKICDDFSDSIYRSTPYGVEDIYVRNPAGQRPHYFDQNYIGKICDPKDKEHNIDDISMLKSVFPSDREESLEIANGLADLRAHLSRLVHAVKRVEQLQDDLSRLPRLSHLIVTEIIQGNPLIPILPDEKTIQSIEYGRGSHQAHVKTLDEIDKFLENNPLVVHDEKLIGKIKEELELAFSRSGFEGQIRDIIGDHKDEIDDAKQAEDAETTTKRQQFESLMTAIVSYMKHIRDFDESLDEISKFKIVITTKEIESMGHRLFIDNEFQLTKETFLDAANSMLKSQFKIPSFNDIRPETLFETRFRKRDPKVVDYEDFERKVNVQFEGMNHKKYRVITKEGKDFETLSAGWKTSIILDLILGWAADNAPLIIDQPEDNLAIGYVNSGLLNAIKKCKSAKQIILVSHNATIPMLGDAQNVIMCRNDENYITIRSNPLEGTIDGTKVVDHIAETTDGGKASVKKRFKKYHLRSYRGDYETSI